ncbi:hypothetical protein R5R35_009108 [Gryllus longicercus]|uniref:Uncharacterized protein n=1 Tax=Gryllus longicercus TaxID=2509291 RepID=A0AAN9W9T6_9ORTH
MPNTTSHLTSMPITTQVLHCGSPRHNSEISTLSLLHAVVILKQSKNKMYLEQSTNVTIENQSECNVNNIHFKGKRDFLITHLFELTHLLYQPCLEFSERFLFHNSRITILERMQPTDLALIHTECGEFK